MRENGSKNSKPRWDLLGIAFRQVRIGESHMAGLYQKVLCFSVPLASQLENFSFGERRAAKWLTPFSTASRVEPSTEKYWLLPLV